MANGYETLLVEAIRIMPSSNVCIDNHIIRTYLGLVKDLCNWEGQDAE